jgi:predicted RecA/RadA family phage recombinase
MPAQAAFKKEAIHRIDYVATADMVPGEVVPIGDLGIGVVEGMEPVKSGDLTSLNITDDHTFDAVSAEEIDKFDRLYWDATAKKLTLDDDTGNNVLAAMAVFAKAAGVTTVRAKLLGLSAAAPAA